MASNKIVYEHDDTETTDDKFDISLSDGTHEVTQTIPITIRPVDDETPRMTINNGIDVDIDQSKIITNNELKVNRSMRHFDFVRLAARARQIIINDNHSLSDLCVRTLEMNDVMFDVKLHVHCTLYKR